MHSTETSPFPPVITVCFAEERTGHFLGALLFPYYMAVLQSPDFQVATLNILYFKFFRASAGANIRICFETDNFKFTTSDELKHCRTIIPDLDVNNARRWNGVRVMLLPGYTKVKSIKSCEQFVQIHNEI